MRHKITQFKDFIMPYVYKINEVLIQSLKIVFAVLGIVAFSFGFGLFFGYGAMMLGLPKETSATIFVVTWAVMCGVLGFVTIEKWGLDD